MSVRKLRLTPAARKDYRGIQRESLLAWGEDRSIAYGQQLNDAMEHLAHYPELGKSAAHHGEGVRVLRVNQHVMHHGDDEQAVRVHSLLHIRMDAASQFRS